MLSLSSLQWNIFVRVALTLIVRGKLASPLTMRSTQDMDLSDTWLDKVPERFVARVHTLYIAKEGAQEHKFRPKLSKYKFYYHAMNELLHKSRMYAVCLHIIIY